MPCLALLCLALLVDESQADGCVQHASGWLKPVGNTVDPRALEPYGRKVPKGSGRGNLGNQVWTRSQRLRRSASTCKGPLEEQDATCKGTGSDCRLDGPNGLQPKQFRKVHCMCGGRRPKRNNAKALHLARIASGSACLLVLLVCGPTCDTR